MASDSQWVRGWRQAKDGREGAAVPVLRPTDQAEAGPLMLGRAAGPSAPHMGSHAIMACFVADRPADEKSRVRGTATGRPGRFQSRQSAAPSYQCNISTCGTQDVDGRHFAGHDDSNEPDKHYSRFR